MEGSQWRLAENKAGGRHVAASRLFAVRHRGEHEARLCIPGPIGEAGCLCARQVKADGIVDRCILQSAIDQVKCFHHRIWFEHPYSRVAGGHLQAR